MKLLGFTLLACLVGASSNLKTETSTSPPNIILFIVDDLGWQDTSVPFWDRATPFNQRYRTPNMERLASQSMKFTQAYATPVCSPTRVSLLTGMNAARHRVTNWTLHRDLIQPFQIQFLLPSCFPSILEIADIDQYKTTQTVDGISFVPLLKDNHLSTLDRPLYWHFPNEWGPTGPGIGAFSAVRKGEWKLIYYHKDQRFELFNISNDIGETTNLVESQQKICKDLAALLTSYLLSVNAQMPKNKQSGKRIPMPG